MDRSLFGVSSEEAVDQAEMKITLCENAADAQRWQDFVETHPECTNYHRWNWKQVIEDSFGWPTYYLMAEEGAEVHGILPLVWQKSWLFGSFVSSLPFLNGGGIVANGKDAEENLLGEAIRLARQVKADYLELRQRGDHQLNLLPKTNKVTVVLPVQSDSERMWKAMETKIRTKVRKSMSFGLTAEFGGRELLDDFYRVFCENMRDLGTPVYSPDFFSEILRVFPEDSHLCVVRHQGTAVAASFLSGFRDTVEAVWSSSIRRYLSMKPNMFLYWNLFCFAGQRGYRIFDFGRSTVGSGTHDFKLQWGSQTVPLHWVYWLPHGDHLPELNPENPKYRAAIWVWQRLPLGLTRKLGPKIVRCLP